MNKLVYGLAMILVIIWAIGFVGFNAGGIVHILLVITVLFRII